MGITLGQLRKRLIGELDVIPSSMSKAIINDSLRDIYDSNDWGFLFTDSYIRTPAMLQGTANVVQFNNQITLDATLNTSLLNSSDTSDKVQADERQVKLLSPRQQDRGFIYNITDYDSGTGILTLDKPWQDVDNTAAQIQILKLYYLPPTFDIGTPTSPNPVIDFRRFEYIMSPQFNRRLSLDISLPEINNYDPTRFYTGDPYCLVPYSANSNGEQLFELYPSPRFERVLRVKYLRNGQPLSKDSDTIPNLFSSELIMSRAKIKAYEWAMANSDNTKVKAPSKFQNLIALLNSPNNPSSYTNLLQTAVKKDEELYPKAFLGDFAEIPSYDFSFMDYGSRMFGETLILDF